MRIVILYLKMSTNNRWNRYIYLASQFRKFKLLNNSNKNWLDIGRFMVDYKLF